MRSKMNELGFQILKAKYLAPEENISEDLFMRVSKVGSIPDVFDALETDFKKTPETTNVIEAFEPFQDVAKRVAQRRFGSDRYYAAISVEEIGGIWKQEATKYCERMCNLEFMPATPTLINSGRGGMLSSCFFLRVGDSIDDIFRVIREAALILKAGGGVGFDFSEIRPEGSVVSSTNGTATGPISYMKIINTMGDQINQAGIRKAAIMAVLRVDHPDIFKFVSCKREEGNLANFNISVFITDKFMAAVNVDDTFVLQHPKSDEIKTVRAREIWDLIVERAWRNGEPGIIFEDTVAKKDVFRGKFGKLGPNPCQPADALLLDGDKLRRISEGGDTWKSWKTGVKEVLLLKCSNGLEIRCTPEHKIMLEDGSFEEAQNCLGKTLKRYKASNPDQNTSKEWFNKGVDFGGTIQEQKEIPYEVMTATIYNISNFMRGLIHSNSDIQSANIKLLKDIQVLSALLGTVSIIYKDSSHKLYMSIPMDLDVQEISSLGEQEVWDYRMNQPPHYNFCQGAILANCGELLLINYESCNLAAINLGTCVDEVKGKINIKKLRELTKLGIKFLDNIVDINEYPLPEIERITLMARKIGLGTTGLHDALLKMELLYGSNKSLDVIDTIYSTIKATAIEMSTELGKQRGIPEELETANLLQRNAGLLTVQPTGSISLLMNQASSGVEPVFQWVYTRKDTFGTHSMEHPIIKKFGVDKLPDYAKTALEIPPENHVRVQAVIQKHICSSISKTVNLPTDATITDVEKVFMLAHQSGCKSLTVYRTGSREKEVLVNKKKVAMMEKVGAESVGIRHRPRVLLGATFRINTPGGKAYITVNEDSLGIREVFIHVSKAGSEVATHVESSGRLISNSLKFMVPIDSMVRHLEGQKSSPILEHGEFIKSIPDAVAKALKEYGSVYEGFSEYFEDGKPNIDCAQTEIPIDAVHSGGLCGSCGEPLFMESGCEVCHSCGYSQCG